MSHNGPLVPIPRIIDCLRDIDSLQEVCIVGGEPLLYKERIGSILDSVQDKGLRTTIVTNGVLMDERFLNAIANHRVHLVISIDTIDKEFWKYVRGVDSFDLVMGNLKSALEILSPEQLSIQSVLAEETKEHVGEVREFADRHGIYQSIQPYLQEGFEGTWTTEQANGKRETAGRCYAAGRNLSIMPNGDVFTCFQQNLIEGCDHAIGNITEDRIKDLLSTEYIESVMERMITCTLPCKQLKCNLKEEC